MSYINKLKSEREELLTQTAETILAVEIEQIKVRAEQDIENLKGNFDANRQKSIEAIDNRLLGIKNYLEELESLKDINESEELENPQDPHGIMILA